MRIKQSCEQERMSLFYIIILRQLEKKMLHMTPETWTRYYYREPSIKPNICFLWQTEGIDLIRPVWLNVALWVICKLQLSQRCFSALHYHRSLLHLPDFQKVRSLASRTGTIYITHLQNVVVVHIATPFLALAGLIRCFLFWFWNSQDLLRIYRQMNE